MQKFTHQRVTSRRQALLALGRVVYAVRLSDGVIKIGCTSNLDGRVRTLVSLSGGGELLAFRPGTEDDEQDIHAELKPHRARAHEYYHPTPAVIAVVNDMRRELGLEAVTR